MFIEDASKILRIERNGREVFVDQDNLRGNVPEDKILMNRRREGTYEQYNLSYIKTTDNEYLVPVDMLSDFVTSDNDIHDIPDESWEISNWIAVSLRKSTEMVGDEYVVNEEFPILPDDEPLVKLAKKTINHNLPQTFRVRSRSDRRRVRERINEIKNNRLSAKQFFKLMRTMEKQVRVVVDCDYRSGDGVSEIVT